MQQAFEPLVEGVVVHEREDRRPDTLVPRAQECRGRVVACVRPARHGAPAIDRGLEVGEAQVERLQRVFQLGSGRPTSVNELIEAIGRTVAGEAEVRVRYAPFRPGEVHTTWCDISKARRTFGFEPATSLEDGLRTTWTWFRDVWSRTQSD